MTNMTDEQKKSLQKVVAYLWSDEQRDYESNTCDGHIFASLIRLLEPPVQGPHIALQRRDHVVESIAQRRRDGARHEVIGERAQHLR